MVVTDPYTNVNPLALLILGIVMIVVLSRGRQTAAVALLFAALLIPLGQQFVVLGLHIRFFRLLILVGFARLMFRGELGGVRLTTIDRLIIATAAVGVACGIVRGPKPETFGVAYDALGTFFLFRFLMRGSGDALPQLRFFAVAALLLALAMSIELSTHHNPLYIFGGVPEITYVREGRFRCQGPFRHPILAGTFAASLAPLMAALWLQDARSRVRAAVGLAACAFCSFAAASSGAMLTLLGAGAAFALWPLRRHMRACRWAAVAILGVLALSMNAPVWYLIARISDMTGGTGWHRSFLIDLAVRNLGDWWLVGFGHTMTWAPASWQGAPGTSIDADSLDITNHYLHQGLSGGLLQLGLFLGTIVSGYRVIGRAIREELALPLAPKVLWAMGACLSAHCMAFISVSYFDQIQVFWYWLLALLSILSVEVGSMEKMGTLAASAGSRTESSEDAALPRPILVAGATGT